LLAAALQCNVSKLPYPVLFCVVISRRKRHAGNVPRTGERIGAYRALVGKPAGNRPLGSHRIRLEGNIKKNFEEKR
jgi:hypothetical protein